MKIKVRILIFIIKNSISTMNFSFYIFNLINKIPNLPFLAFNIFLLRHPSYIAKVDKHLVIASKSEHTLLLLPYAACTIKKMKSFQEPKYLRRKDFFFGTLSEPKQFKIISMGWRGVESGSKALKHNYFFLLNIKEIFRVSNFFSLSKIRFVIRYSCTCVYINYYDSTLSPSHSISR